MPLGIGKQASLLAPGITNSFQHKWIRPHTRNGESMSANGSGAGRKFLSFIIFLLFAGLAGFLIYEYSPLFKASPEEDTAGMHKIDKSTLIANLEKKVRRIPAENIAANLEGYRRLLKLAPGNIRYKKKVDYYSARLKKAASADKSKSGMRHYIKVGYPSPRVLDQPENGQMLGRVEAGSLVEVLDTMAVASGSLKTTWYNIRYGAGSAWLSQLGTSGDLIEQAAPARQPAAPGKADSVTNPWERLAATMIEDYGGKIISIDRLDLTESHFSLYDGMSPEQVRQTCENIGYYIRNSTGTSPVIVAFIDRIPVARAEPAGTKYQAKLIAK